MACVEYSKREWKIIARPHHQMSVAGHCMKQDDIHFSTDGTRVACRIEAGMQPRRFTLYHDGVSTGQLHGIEHVTFSPDSRRLAWMQTEDFSSPPRIVVDDVRMEIPARSSADPILFSPNSAHVAYVGQGADMHQVVVVHDGDPFDVPSTGASALVFSPDSQRIAWINHHNGVLCIAVDGTSVKQLRTGNVGHFHWKNGTTIIHTVTINGEEVITEISV